MPRKKSKKNEITKFEKYLLKREKEKERIEIFIDFSTTCTGYAVALDGVIITHGTVSRQSKEDAYQYTHRLGYILNTIIIEMDTKDNRCDVVIEDGYTAINPRTGLMLAFHRGQLLAYLHPSHYVEVLPAQWRKRVGIKGNATREISKDRAIKMLTTHYFPTPGEDECEAICIGFACGVPLKISDDHMFMPMTDDRLPI